MREKALLSPMWRIGTLVIRQSLNPLRPWRDVGKPFGERKKSEIHRLGRIFGSCTQYKLDHRKNADVRRRQLISNQPLMIHQTLVNALELINKGLGGLTNLLDFIQALAEEHRYHKVIARGHDVGLTFRQPAPDQPG